MKDGEAQALEFMKAIKPQASSWIVVYFQLSDLKAHNKTPVMLDNARFTLQKNIQGHLGKIFALSNDDIVVFIQNMGLIKLEKFATELRRIFADDPLAQSRTGRDNFCKTFHLGQAFETLYAKIETVSSEKFLSGIDLSQHVPLESAPILPFDLLIRLQNTLRQADIQNFIRRQSICWIDGKEELKRIGLEFYLSLEGLEEVINSHTHLITDFALFKHLSVLFDKKMLEYLVPHVKRVDPKLLVHVNLNLRTVVSKEFFEFQKVVNRPLIIEIDRTDMVWDFEGFNFAVDFLKGYGHKTCLDLLRAPNLKLFLNSPIPCDYYKVVCNEDLFDFYFEDLEAFIKKEGPDRLILTRCDSAQLLEKAKKLGIAHIQGFLIEENFKSPHLKNQAF